MYCMHCALLKHLSSICCLHLDSDPFKLFAASLNVFIQKSFDSEWIWICKNHRRASKFSQQFRETRPFDKFFIMLTMLKEVEGCQMSLLKQFQRIYCPPQELGWTTAKPTDSRQVSLLLYSLSNFCFVSLFSNNK